MISTSFGPTFVYWCAQTANAIRASTSSAPPAMIAAIAPPARATSISCEPPRVRRWRRRPCGASRRHGSRLPPCPAARPGGLRGVDLDLLLEAQETGAVKVAADHRRERVLGV